MRDFVNWNLSRAVRTMMRHDAFVVSFPKSGRTWLRVFYFAYLAKLAGREFSWNPAVFPEHPAVFFTHDRWQHRLLPGWWNFIRGKHLIPPRARRERKIVLLVRDPRDVVVSLHFHLNNRRHAFRYVPQPMAEMLRDPRLGIGHVVELMNRWLAERLGSPNFDLVRYEDCQADAARTFCRLLNFLGLSPVNDEALAFALEFSRFDNMRAMEAAGRFKEDELSAANSGDTNSFKARRGKVGGFRDHFNEADLAFASAAMAKLDPRFGYRA